MARLADRPVNHRADMQPFYLPGKRLGPQPIAPARLARMVRLEARQLIPHPGRFRLTPASLDIADHPLEALGGRVVADAIVIGEGDLVLARAVQDDVAEVLRQRLPWLGHGLAIGAG